MGPRRPINPAREAVEEAEALAVDVVVMMTRAAVRVVAAVVVDAERVVVDADVAVVVPVVAERTRKAPGLPLPSSAVS
jgi:hypothetical protein